MISYKRLCCACAVLLSLSGVARATPVTINFRADRTQAAAGETVRWTVWVEFDEAHHPGAFLAGVAADLVPNRAAAGLVGAPMPLVISETEPAQMLGLSVLGVRLNCPSGEALVLRRVPIYSFEVTITDAAIPLWFDFDGLAIIAENGAGAPLAFYTRADGSAGNHQRVLRVKTDAVNFPSRCPADVAPAFGDVNAADFAEFMELFMIGSPQADLAEPFGVTDSADLARFMLFYSRSCAETEANPEL